MDRSDSGAAEQPLNESEAKPIRFRISVNIPRRQLTLLGITLLLNLLLWSALICLTTSIYQIVSDPADTTNIAPVALASTSALTTIVYTFLHTTFSLKRTIWMHQHRNLSAIKKTSYIAIRIVISMCVLWLLTSGWNMILVARRPNCLGKGPGLQRWEFGTTCQMARVGIAFAMIALIASGILFGTLATVRRPFEAHLFRYSHCKPLDVCPTPAAARRPPPSRRGSSTAEKLPIGRRMSTSTHKSMLSNFSGTDVGTPSMHCSPPLSTIYAPSPIRNTSLGIFTSNSTPPPIPVAYNTPRRASSNDMMRPVFHPSMSHIPLSRPPRLSGVSIPSGFVPSSISVQYSASTWRAVHPSDPPLILPTSRLYPHLPSTGFMYRRHYSHSSVSLTRPHRLSTATPGGSVDRSSGSGSTGPEGRDSPPSGEADIERRATSSQIAYAILNGTAIPGTRQLGLSRGHMRTTSAPDVTSGAQQSHRLSRMAKGWKPHLAGQDLPANEAEPSAHAKPVNIIQSLSTSLLSRFSPDTSPDDDVKQPHVKFEKELNARRNITTPLPVRRSRSADLMRHTSAPTVAQAAANMVSKMPQNLRAPKVRASSAEAPRQEMMTFDEIKNKPLPKIAVLL